MTKNYQSQTSYKCLKYRAENWSFHLGSERVQGTWTLRNSLEKINRCYKDHLCTFTYMFSEVIFQCVKQSIGVNQHHLFEGKEFIRTLWQLNAFLSSFGHWDNCKWYHISFTVKHSCALGESVSQNKGEVSFVTHVFYYFKQCQTLASDSWFCRAF